MATYNSSIYVAPAVVTDTSPYLVLANFHTAIVRGSASLQTDFTSFTGYKDGHISILYLLVLNF